MKQFPNGGLSVDSTVSVVAAYDAETHTLSVTLNGSPFASATEASRKMHRDHAIDVLRELDTTLHNMYNVDPEEFRDLFAEAHAGLF